MEFKNLKRELADVGLKYGDDKAVSFPLSRAAAAQERNDIIQMVFWSGALFVSLQQRGLLTNNKAMRLKGEDIVRAIDKDTLLERSR